MNTWIGIGYISRQPDLRYLQDGTAVCNFVVAINRPKRKGGEESVADFVPCVAWRKQAEAIASHLTTGSHVAVNGSWRSRKYTTDDGKNRIAWEVLAHDVRFLGGKRQQEQSTQPQQQDEFGAHIDFPDDDTPFF